MSSPKYFLVKFAHDLSPTDDEKHLAHQFNLYVGARDPNVRNSVTLIKYTDRIWSYPGSDTGYFSLNLLIRHFAQELGATITDIEKTAIPPVAAGPTRAQGGDRVTRGGIIIPAGTSLNL